MIEEQDVDVAEEFNEVAAKRGMGQLFTRQFGHIVAALEALPADANTMRFTCEFIPDKTGSEGWFHISYLADKEKLAALEASERKKLIDMSRGIQIRLQKNAYGQLEIKRPENSDAVRHPHAAIENWIKNDLPAQRQDAIKAMQTADDIKYGCSKGLQTPHR